MNNAQSDLVLKIASMGLPSNLTKSLYALEIDTPLGSIGALSDETHLYLLDFLEHSYLENKIYQLAASMKAKIQCEPAPPLTALQKELDAYFSGKLRNFTTPLAFVGSPFQQMVWEALCRIPYGQKISYAELACNIEKPMAFRAAANANGKNKFAIIVPCHRVISSSGGLGGYSSGLHRKKWLLEHEEKFSNKL